MCNLEAVSLRYIACPKSMQEGKTMRKVLIAGVAGLFMMFGCGRSWDSADGETTATLDSAQGAVEIPLSVSAPVVDSARIRDSLRARARRDSARAKAARDSAKAAIDRAIANRRRY